MIRLWLLKEKLIENGKRIIKWVIYQWLQTLLYNQHKIKRKEKSQSSYRVKCALLMTVSKFGTKEIYEYSANQI